MLAVIAGDHVKAVIDLIGQRFQHERDTGDFHYEGLSDSLGVEP